MSKALDIGCGDIPRNPFDADEIYGVDVRDNLEGNIKCADLAIEGIPFPDNHFDYVTAHDFLEHVPRVIYVPCEESNRPRRRNAFIELMNEVYRVLKPGGLFLSITPGFPNDVAFRDPTHVNFITDETFTLYFDDVNRWASIYGFKGAFRINTQKCGFRQVRAIMQKVEIHDSVFTYSEKNSLISVVVPVYNGKKYLASTIESILSQTYKNFEAIFIDDCSTDSSGEILQLYAKRDARIRVITTPQNLGSASKVINFIKEYIEGAFFVYSSQDDLFSNDWLENMLHRKIETSADAVIPQVVLYYDDTSKNRSLIGMDGNDQVFITGRQAFELSLNWRIPGNALWNSEMITKIGFEEFSVNSDEYSVRKFFLSCKKIAFSKGIFYYRQNNDQAVTKRKTPNSFDWPYTQLRVAQLLQEYSFPIRLVDNEVKSAISMMKRLREWLEKNGSYLSLKETDLINHKIERFENRLQFKYPFANLPVQWKMSRTRFEEKWKKSFWRIKLNIRNALPWRNHL